MSQRLQILLDCDVHEGQSPDDVSTTRFTVDGSTYEVDLCLEHKEEFDEFLSTYIGLGRRLGGRKRQTKATLPKPRVASNGKRKQTSLDTHAVRAWANSNGHTVAKTGKVPTKVLEAYTAAH